MMHAVALATVDSDRWKTAFCCRRLQDGPTASGQIHSTGFDPQKATPCSEPDNHSTADPEANQRSVKLGKPASLIRKIIQDDGPCGICRFHFC